MFIKLKLNKDTDFYVNLDHVDSIVHYLDKREIDVKYNDKIADYYYSKEQVPYNEFVLKEIVKNGNV